MLGDEKVPGLQEALLLRVALDPGHEHQDPEDGLESPGAVRMFGLPNLMALFPHLRSEKLMEGLRKRNLRGPTPTSARLPLLGLVNSRPSHKPFLPVDELVEQTHSGGKRLFQLRQLAQPHCAAEAVKRSISLDSNRLKPRRHGKC